MDVLEYLEESQRVLAACRRHPSTLRAEEAVDTIVDAFKAHQPLLVCGNGGSAADAMHITGELVGRFRAERRACNCICLSSNPAVITAWSNDYSYETVFARQVEAYGVGGGVLLGLSTSGNSPNVLEAFRVARELGLSTIGLTGEGGGRLAPLSSLLIAVPSTSTQFIQQAHICIYHYICEQVEARVARSDAGPVETPV